MAADYTIRQGATQPTWVYTLTRNDGSSPNLTGATVALNLRQLTASSALTLGGTVAITNPATGLVTYTPTAADTANAGQYMATFTVTYGGGGIEVFPPTGYLSVTVEPNLTATGSQQIVSLPEVKDYIGGFATADHSRDSKLLAYINAATVLIENLAGPVIVRNYDEWHQGGQFFIQLRRRPSFAPGMNPVLTIVSCDEYRGPVKYALSVVGEPTQASIYSVMLDPRIGTLYRRTAGGGVIPFGAGPWGGAMPDAVHVIYQAGQSPIPWNVVQAAKEIVRANYETTQPTGGGSRVLADQLGESLDRPGLPLGGYLPPVARELLAPMRRHPSVA